MLSNLGRFLIVRLDDIQPAKVKSLDEVRDDIAAKVKHEKALDAYYALQQKVSDAASNDTESLAGAEQAAGVKPLRRVGSAKITCRKS
mgnify:CR=1 FL=1